MNSGPEQKPAAAQKANQNGIFYFSLISLTCGPHSSGHIIVVSTVLILCGDLAEVKPDRELNSGDLLPLTNLGRAYIKDTPSSTTPTSSLIFPAARLFANKLQISQIPAVAGDVSGENPSPLGLCSVPFFPS
jgi:hypothetical protein